MPLYEYRCNDCQRKFSKLIRSLENPPEIKCTNCGSQNSTRLMSTFARLKTDQDVYDEILNDRDLTRGMANNDPKAMLEWSRKMEGSENEKDTEYGEVIERMERGESLAKIAGEYMQNESPAGESGSD